MAKLKNIRIRKETIGIPDSIQLDWDNDRHQAVPLKGRDSVAVMKALDELADVLHTERRRGKI